MSSTSPSLGPATLAVTWAEAGLATVFFALRIYTHAFITHRWKADFWWALLTYLLALTSSITLSLSVKFGLGKHLADLEATDPQSISTNQFWEWIFITFCVTAITTGKLAIIAFIMQIEASTVQGARKWVLWIFAALNVILNIFILIPIIWVQCTPTAKIWNNELPGNCAGRERNQHYGYFQGSFGALIDLAMALYPIIIFWNLKMQRHVKVGLMGLFSFGVVAAASSAVKTYELSTLTATADLTYQLANLDIWASTEMWVIFIVACVPTIRPLFVKVFHKVYASGSRSFGTGRGYIAQEDTKNTGNRSRAFASSSKTADISTKPISSSNESEENILPGQTGIMMTSHISVKYEEEGGRSDNGRSDADRDWKTGAHFEAV